MLKIAALQMPVVNDKDQNIETALEYIGRAVSEGANIAVLPEMFNCPYEHDRFPEFAEPADGKTCKIMSETAAKYGICLVAGSIPEDDGGKFYNTSFVFGPDGALIARHRKMHMFDIDIPGGQYFKESDSFNPGSDVTVFEFGGMKFGLCICFDFRFPYLAGLMMQEGAQAMIVPASFNMTTGPAHWVTMFRQRAVDNQVYTIGAAPARDENGSYVSFSNSIICDPYGKILEQLDKEPGIITADLSPKRVEAVRNSLPLIKSLRSDVYELRRVK